MAILQDLLTHGVLLHALKLNRRAVAVFSDAKCKSRGIAPAVSEGGTTGAEVTFQNSIIGTFMIIKIDLKRIYCSYLRTQKIKNGFL